MAAHTETGKGSRSDHDLVEFIAAQSTPSDETVADWHRIEALLDRDWERPLVRLLRGFVTNESQQRIDVTTVDVDMRESHESEVAA